MSVRVNAGGLLLVLGTVLVGCQDLPSAENRGPQLEKVASDSQSAEVGGLILPAVRATYAGRPLPNISISWATDGNGVVDEVTRTDSRGIAAAQWFLGTRPGSYRLTVSGAGPQPLQFTATARAGGLAWLRLRPDSGVLSSVRDSIQLSAVVTDRFNNPLALPAISWSSLDPLVAGVGSTGLVRGRTGGTARVVASTTGAADTALVRVIQVPAQLALTPRLDTLRWLQATLPLQVRVRDLYGNDMPSAPVTWTSLNPSVLRVGTGGTVTALANGTGRVVARSGTVADTATLVVFQVVEGVWVNPIAATVAVGDSVRLVATAHDRTRTLIPPPFPTEWVSYDESIATVSGDATGWVKGVSTGTATVRVFSTGGVFATAVITVVAAPSVP